MKLIQFNWEVFVGYYKNIFKILPKPAADLPAAALDPSKVIMTFMALQSVPIESSYSLHRTYNFEKIHESFHAQFSFFLKI